MYSPTVISNTSSRSRLARNASASAALAVVNFLVLPVRASPSKYMTRVPYFHLPTLAWLVNLRHSTCSRVTVMPG